MMLVDASNNHDNDNGTDKDNQSDHDNDHANVKDNHTDNADGGQCTTRCSCQASHYAEG